MTVGVRRALVRLVLLAGGVVILLMLWDARAAGAEEAPLIEPVLSELLDLGPDAVDDLAPATIPMVGDDLAPAADLAPSGIAEPVHPPIPAPAPEPENRGAPAPAPPPEELAAPPAAASSPRAPAGEHAPTDGAGDSGPTRPSKPGPRPTPDLAVLALAFAWAVVLGARPRDEAAWRPGITPLRPLSRPG